jgi:hypothetical protein
MRWWLVIIVLFALLAAAVAMIVVYSREPAPETPATKPAQPTSKPATASAVQPPAPAARIQAYSDLLHALPGMADATISEEKLPLEQAARIHLPYWAYICPRRDLWISHPDAPSISTIADDGSQAVHLSREQVCFVHWYRSGRSYKALPVIRDGPGAYLAIRKAADR